MLCLDFDWQTNEFMLYCRTTQLREKSMMAYEQSLKLFQRWCMDEMGIFTVDKVTENVIRRYILELRERGKYTFYIVDKQKKTSPAMCPGHTVGEVLFIRVPLHRQPEAGGAARQHPYGILRQRFRSIRHLRCWQAHRR